MKRSLKSLLRVALLLGLVLLPATTHSKEEKTSMTTKTLGIRGKRISVNIAGQKNGIPIVLLHGAFGTCSDHMSPLIQPLAQQGFWVICPDLAGYGKSQPRTRVFTVKSSYRSYFHQDAADMAEVVRKLSPKKPVLIAGYSDGGEVGLIMTALYPNLVRGSLLWGTSGKITTELIDTFASLIPPPGDPLWDLAGDEGWKDWKDILVSRHGEASTMSATMTYSGAVQAIYDKGGWLLSDIELSKVKRRVYLAYGVKDEYNPEKEIQELARKIPVRQEIVNGVPMTHNWATLHRMEEVGHTPQKEEKGLLMLLSSLKRLAVETAE